MPGLSFLALLAAPGLVYWLAFGHLMLFARDSHWTIGLVFNPVLVVVCLGAGIPALGCRAPKLLRWSVCVVNCAPLLLLAYVCSTLRLPPVW